MMLRKTNDTKLPAGIPFTMSSKSGNAGFVKLLAMTQATIEAEIKRKAKGIPPALSTSANGFPISGTVNASVLFIGELLPLLIVILLFSAEFGPCLVPSVCPTVPVEPAAFQWSAGY